MANIGTFPILFVGAGAPTGFASPHQLYVDGDTGDLYTSAFGSWHLIASSSSGGFAGVNSQAGDYTALSTDDQKLIVMTKATAKTLTLPATAPSTKWSIYVQNTGAGNLTIDRNGLTIDGVAANLTLVQNEGIFVATNGSSYFTSRGSPPVMVGDGGSGGKVGLVPAPASGDAAANKFLKADGTWSVASMSLYSNVTVNIGDGVNAITTGVKQAIPVDFAGTIVGWQIVETSGTSGSITVEVSKKAGTQTAPVIPNPTSDKISASAPISLSSATTNGVDATGVSTWTTSVAQWDTIQFKVATASSVKRVVITLRIQRS